MFESRPVWKQDTEDKNFLFFSGFKIQIEIHRTHTFNIDIEGLAWLVAKDFSASGNLTSSVYGWDYSTNETCWPMTSTLIITG